LVKIEIKRVYDAPSPEDGARILDLRRLGAPAAPRTAPLGLAAGRTRRGSPRRIRSLAVLPLENLGRDPEQEYFAEGMTETLITNLAKIRALKSRVRR
jgi:hypothetical protein